MTKSEWRSKYETDFEPFACGEYFELKPILGIESVQIDSFTPLSKSLEELLEELCMKYHISVPKT